GQGAKTAAQTLALAGLHSGLCVQAFPEYGPERRGAPLRAYTRLSDRPIRRHDGVTDPDLVVVLEPSVIGEADVAVGLKPGGVVLVNSAEPPAALAGLDVRCIAAAQNTNLVMLGAVAAQLGEPPLAALQAAAVEELGAKLPPE